MATNEINENNKCGMQDIYSSSTAYNANQEQIKKAFSQIETVFLAKIVSCSSSGQGGAKTVNAIPLVAKVDANGNAQASPTYVELPHYRFQAGTGALIIDPQPGDIGVFVCAKRDISKINSSTQTPQVPGSFRAFSPSDSIMIGTIHTKDAVTWIQIVPTEKTITIHAPSGCTIESDTSVTVKAPDVTVQATNVTIQASKVSINAPETTISGHLTVQGGMTVSGGDGSTMSGNFSLDGSMTATGDVTAGGISLDNHVHSGVQSGGSNTGKPQ